MKIRKMARLVAVAGLLALAGCSSYGGGDDDPAEILPLRLNEILDQTMTTLAGISGPDQAVSANAGLLDAEAELTSLVDKAAAADPETQEELSAMAAQAMPELQEAANRAMGTPGVADIVGPTLESLTRLLGGLL